MEFVRFSFDFYWARCEFPMHYLTIFSISYLVNSSFTLYLYFVTFSVYFLGLALYFLMLKFSILFEILTYCGTC